MKGELLQSSIGQDCNRSGEQMFTSSQGIVEIIHPGADVPPRISGAGSPADELRLPFLTWTNTSRPQSRRLPEHGIPKLGQKPKQSMAQRVE